MVKLFASEPLYSRHISFSSSTIGTHPNIMNNFRFWPYFKDAIGAIDGSHIPAFPPQRDRAAYRNRKGFVSQNCLFACDFGMKFTYVLTGWEGSATDARVFQDACTTSLHIPLGKYFLADAGFPLTPGALVPYRKTRYHLAEWRKASLRYAHFHYVISVLTVIFQASKQRRTIQFASCVGSKCYRAYLRCHKTSLSNTPSPPRILHRHAITYSCRLIRHPQFHYITQRVGEHRQ